MSEQWVLAGVYSSGPSEGKPQYHMADTAIGPASTPDLDRAKVFASKEDAFTSSGFTHWASFLEPKTLAEARADLAALSHPEETGRG